MSTPPVVVVGISGKLVGINTRTGQVEWENAMKGGGYGAVALAITDTRIFASAGSSTVFCLAYPSGEQLWTVETSASGRASLIVEGDVLIVSKGGEVDGFALDGKKLWSQGMRGAGVGRSAIGVPGNVMQADDYGSQ